MNAGGHLWHDESEFDDPETLKFFLENLQSLADGRYHVLCQGEDCFITCEDVPYVVCDLNWEDPKKPPLLIFQGGYTEPLDPATLWVGKENILYCKVRGGGFPARFSRKSYLELAKWIEFDPRSRLYRLTLGKNRYTIKV